NLNEVAVIRRNPAGMADTLFNSQGYLLTSLGGVGAMPVGVQVQRDERILICGHHLKLSQPTTVMMRRFEWNGQADTSWGTEGLSSYSFGVGLSGFEAGRMLLQPDGKVV